MNDPWNLGGNVYACQCEACANPTPATVADLEEITSRLDSLEGDTKILAEMMELARRMIEELIKQLNEQLKDQGVRLT